MTLDRTVLLTIRPSHSTMPIRTARSESDGSSRIWSQSVRLPLLIIGQSTDCIGGPVGQHLVTACSPAELAAAIPFTNLYLPTYTMALAYEADHVFTNLLRMSDHDSHVPVVVKLGVDSMQVASVSHTHVLVGSKLTVAVAKIGPSTGTQRVCDRCHPTQGYRRHHAWYRSYSGSPHHQVLPDRIRRLCLEE